MDDHPIRDPRSPSLPNDLATRPFLVREGSTCTFRLMHDPPRPKNRFGGAIPVKAKCEVLYYVNAEEAFPAMAAAMKTANAKGHFIYFANWYTDLDVGLEGPHSGSLRSLLEAAASKGVQVRALLYKNVTQISARPYQAIKEFNDFVFVPYATNEEDGGWKEPSYDLTDAPFAKFSSKKIEGAVAAALAGVTSPHVHVHGDAPYHNGVEAETIRGLGSGPPGFCAAILDGHLPFAGAHHQKILIVNGTDGLLAFVGGMDFNGDRWQALYDVHCRVRGEGALAVLDVFNERWNAHPDRAKEEHGQAHIGVPNPFTPPSLPDAISDVEVGRTYCDSTRKIALPVGESDNLILLREARTRDPFFNGPPPYPFAVGGATQVFDMMKRAIQRATRFLYIESQYFVSVELANLIKDALPKLKHVTMLVQGFSDIDKDKGLSRTQKCIDIVRSADPSREKFRVFVRLELDPGLKLGKHPYVHAKLLVADDEYAIVGSANNARRSFDFDSECSIGVFDRVPEDKAMLSFARRLRMRLWADHLDGFARLAELADGVGAVSLWDEIAASPRVMSQGWQLETWENFRARFPGKTTPADDWEWDHGYDPIPPAPT